MNRRVLVTVLAFSLAVNAAAAGSVLFFWAKAQASPVEISLGHKPMKTFLKEDLRLTPDQLSSILNVIDEKKPAIIELTRRLDLARKQMKALVTADSLDMKALESKVGEVNQVHGQIRAITIGTVARIAASLPQNAKNQFVQYIRSCGDAPGSCAPGMGKGPYGDVKPAR